MALGQFDNNGDLPEGVHRATLDEILARFGHGTPQREAVTGRLLRIYELVLRTKKLERFIIYGSYVTAKRDPGDVDIILVMRDDFLLPECDDEVGRVFDHLRAQVELGASVFWTLRGGVFLETLDEFVAGWQIKRDHTLHGIVELMEKQP